MSGEVEQVTEAPAESAVEEAVTEQPQEQAVVERDVEQDTLDIPNSAVEGGKERYVPLSALDGARKELKGLKAELEDAKAGSSRAQQLESRIDELSAQLAQIAPKAQAYDAAVAAQQNYREPAPEDDAEAVELAQILDLYTPEGKPDVAKAKKAMVVMGRIAGKEADGRVAPLAKHTVHQMSDLMLQRALVTKAQNGVAPDPKILKQVWNQLDPRLTATVEGAREAWLAAVSRTIVATEGGQAAPQANRSATGQFTKKQEIGAPLFTEKAGGKDAPETNLAISDRERDYMKKAGISEKEYLESARNAPWLRR